MEKDIYCAICGVGFGGFQIGSRAPEALEQRDRFVENRRRALKRDLPFPSPWDKDRKTESEESDENDDEVDVAVNHNEQGEIEAGNVDGDEQPNRDRENDMQVENEEQNVVNDELNHEITREGENRDSAIQGLGQSEVPPEVDVDQEEAAQTDGETGEEESEEESEEDDDPEENGPEGYDPRLVDPDSFDWLHRVHCLGYNRHATGERKTFVIGPGEYLRGDDIEIHRGKDRVWVTAFIAVLCIITLSNWDLKASALSGIPVLGLLIVYLALTPRSGKRAGYRRPIDDGRIIRPLAFRVVVTLLAALGLEIVAYGPPRISVVDTILVGVAKSLMWHFLLLTCKVERCSWSVAAAIGTFSIVATRNPFSFTSDIQALSHLIASLFALGQVISLLPDKAKSRSALWICVVVYLVPYLTNIYAIHVAKSSLIQSSHPIDLLIQNAKADFQALLERQSNSYSAACEEYRCRYRMEPPPGFQTWYNFAKAHRSPIIDDFDIIYDRISPFWRISGSEFTEAINRLQDTPNSDVWVCTFSAEATTNCNHPYRSVDRNIQGFLNTVLADLRGLLPDIKFHVNHLDEPRVLLPPSASEGSESLNITSYSKRPVWDTLTKSCPSPESEKADRPTWETFGLPFVTDRQSTMDLCRHSEYRESHGLLISPTSFPLIEGLAPVLSTGSLSTMGDILYPSPAYLEPEFEYVEAKDINWDSKRNNLYWAGSTTGGFAVNDGWQSFHRQRFVKLAQNLGNGRHSYLREGKGVINLVKSSFLNSRLFDVAFTRVFQCEKRYCRDQQALFQTKSWADKDEALHSRLVFDIDGNGISGRYYKLLASKSAPLKQTLLREWHDDRLMPWVHYIPVSQSMEELPEMVTYLTSEAGQERAREIAEQGRDWFSKAFRKEDLTIYLYRLFLELARLQDPERSAKT
ncbi:glycosyltransferase family 90 protein [Aspergillus thermomutatus]|uniref:Glycosyl transferase CAP10 domain-containing protein n=1 Tax=Aspergillus thermomutatus TaxID=41047 RepID=A0A397G3V7_ASPTH|nr:uncharacterized protein CDV56_103672 [Aspergillus thermomutatus]RHZ45712.1 hypothetical protein CDV56_103672 [Aspergillus thermomutatus]